MKTIITDIVVRERLIAGQFFPVILYEDSILNSSESTCGFVARCLQQETSLEFIYILKGKKISFNSKILTMNKFFQHHRLSDRLSYNLEKEEEERERKREERREENIQLLLYFGFSERGRKTFHVFSPFVLPFFSTWIFSLFLLFQICNFSSNGEREKTILIFFSPLKTIK